MKSAKSISLVSIDSYVFALSFFLISVLAARNLSFEALGTFAIVMSVYQLHQSLFITCIGEGAIIFESQDISDNDSLIFSINISLVLSILGGVILFPILLLPLQLSFLDLFAIFITNSLTLMLLSFRYFSLAKKTPLDSIFYGLLMLTGSLFWIFIMPEQRLVSKPVEFFMCIGVGAMVGLLFGIPRANVNYSMENTISILKKRKKFLTKSAFLTSGIWASSHLPQVILGIFFNQTLLGVVRACLTIINPIQTIERGLTNSLLIDSNTNDNNKNDVKKIYKKYLTLISLLHGLIISTWFLFSEKIIFYTIGPKFLAYEDAISIIIFIPLIQSVTAFSSAILRSYNRFSSQIFAYIISPPVMIFIFYLNRDSENPENIMYGFLSIALFQCSIIFFKTIKFLSKNILNV